MADSWQQKRKKELATARRVYHERKAQRESSSTSSTSSSSSSSSSSPSRSSGSRSVAVTRSTEDGGTITVTQSGQVTVRDADNRLVERYTTEQDQASDFISRESSNIQRARATSSTSSITPQQQITRDFISQHNKQYQDSKKFQTPNTYGGDMIRPEPQRSRFYTSVIRPIKRSQLVQGFRGDSDTARASTTSGLYSLGYGASKVSSIASVGVGWKGRVAGSVLGKFSIKAPRLYDGIATTSRILGKSKYGISAGRVLRGALYTSSAVNVAKGYSDSGSQGLAREGWKALGTIQNVKGFGRGFSSTISTTPLRADVKTFTKIDMKVTDSTGVKQSGIYTARLKQPLGTKYTSVKGRIESFTPSKTTYEQNPLTRDIYKISKGQTRTSFGGVADGQGSQVKIKSLGKSEPIYKIGKTKGTRNVGLSTIGHKPSVSRGITETTKINNQLSKVGSVTAQRGTDYKVVVREKGVVFDSFGKIKKPTSHSISKGITKSVKGFSKKPISSGNLKLQQVQKYVPKKSISTPKIDYSKLINKPVKVSGQFLQKPISKTRVTKKTAPVQSTKPIQATMPIQSTGPIQSSKPIQSTKPIQATMPIQSTRPIQSSKPIQSLKPIVPTSPSFGGSSFLGPHTPITPPKLPSLSGGAGSSVKGSRLSFGLKGDYKPTIYATTKGVKRKKKDKGGIITGLGIRGI